MALETVERVARKLRYVQFGDVFLITHTTTGPWKVSRNTYVSSLLVPTETNCQSQAYLLDWSLVQRLLIIMASTTSVTFARVLDSHVFSLCIDEIQGRHILPTKPSLSLSTSLTLTSMSNSERRSATSFFQTGSALPEVLYCKSPPAYDIDLLALSLCLFHNRNKLSQPSCDTELNEPHPNQLHPISQKHWPYWSWPPVIREGQAPPD